MTPGRLPEGKRNTSGARSRLADPALFAALDPTTPGLEGVKQAMDAGDTDAAKKALAAYLRGRTSVPWTVSPKVTDRGAVSWDKQAAEDGAAGKVKVVTIGHTFPGGDIDWFYNKTVADPNLLDNNEWQWQAQPHGLVGSSRPRLPGDRRRALRPGLGAATCARGSPSARRPPSSRTAPTRPGGPSRAASA